MLDHHDYNIKATSPVAPREPVAVYANRLYSDTLAIADQLQRIDNRLRLGPQPESPSTGPRSVEMRPSNVTDLLRETEATIDRIKNIVEAITGAVGEP